MSEEEDAFLEEMRVGRLRIGEALRKAFGPGLAPDPYDHQAYMKVVTKALRERARGERPPDPPAWFQDTPRYPTFAEWEKEVEESVADSIRKLMQEMDDLRFPIDRKSVV